MDDMRLHHSRAQGGSLTLVLVFAAATVVIAVNGVMRPGHGTISLALFFLGLWATWRHYGSWRRARGPAARGSITAA